MVHPVPVDEVRPWLAALATTLLGSPYDDDFAHRVESWRRRWLAERTWGYRDGGRWVATLATQPRNLTVPGPDGGTNDIEVDALTAVTVAATHRRRGLLTGMISDSLRAAKDRGDPLSMLVAAEWPIYGRFGYGPATQDAGYVYHPRRPNAVLPGPPAGSVRQVEPAELREIAPAVFDAARRLRPGQVDRRAPWWDRQLGLDGYHAIGKQPNWVLHEGADGPDGLLCWRVTRDATLTGEAGAIEVPDLIAANDTAYRDLWGYLSGIDLIGEIVLDDRPIDEPIRWQLRDGRALAHKHSFDFVWVRLLDVPAALAARGYAVPGRIVLDVVDKEPGGYGAGRVALEADDTAAWCAPTTEPADLVVTQRALASCYLGGHRLRVLGHEVEELTKGALGRADLMFSVPLAPWTQTGF